MSERSDANRRGMFWLGGFALTCLCLGCAQAPRSRKIAAPPTNLSAYQPNNGYSERSGKLLGRKIFRSSTEDEFQIGLEDVIVPPGTTPAELALNETAILEVRSGEGEAVVKDQPIPLKQGTVFAVVAGEKLTIRASGGPMQLRVVEIGSR